MLEMLVFAIDSNQTIFVFEEERALF